MHITEGALRRSKLRSYSAARVDQMLGQLRELFHPELLKDHAHPLAYRLLLLHGRKCQVRDRAIDVHYSNAGNDSNSKCTWNAVRHALDTGMTLWSGYAYDWLERRAYWHLWNMDFQGYVYDTTYGRMLFRFSYFGVQLNPYIAYEFMCDNNNHFDSGIFLYWSAFEAFEQGLKVHHQKTDEEIWEMVIAAYRDIRI